RVEVVEGEENRRRSSQGPKGVVAPGASGRCREPNMSFDGTPFSLANALVSKSFFLSLGKEIGSNHTYYTYITCMFPSMVFVCRAAHSRIVCTAHLHFRGNFRGIYECGGRNLGGRGARPSAGLHRVICVACGYMSIVTSLLAVQQMLSSRSPYGLGDDDEAVGICGFGDMICQHGCRAMRSPNCPPV
ncbi:unnamed protein product, partial [Pylaiella littoralis]